MSDHIQVSNARRAVFTALAVVVFWVVAWQAFDIFREHLWPRSILVPGSDPSYTTYFTPFWSSIDAWLFVGALTILPVLCLALSHSNRPTRAINWKMTGIGLLMFGTIGFSAWLGFQWHEHWIGVLGLRMHGFSDYEPDHPSSRIWVTLPLGLTTAFVIYGGWRSAVRDSRVGPGEPS